MCKRETERAIGEVWQTKLREQRASVTEESPPLHRFLYGYLVAKHGSASRAVEWGYNLLDGLKRFASDPDCRLFQAILRGELHEHVRADQLATLDELHEHLVGEERALANPTGGGGPRAATTGMLPVNACAAALRRAAPTKPEHSLARLKRQLEFDALKYKGRAVQTHRVSSTHRFQFFTVGCFESGWRLVCLGSRERVYDVSVFWESRP